MRLARRQPDGSRLGEHLEALRARTGRAHPLLAGPALPAAGEALWAWFVELRAAQAAHLPLGFADIAAWAKLTGQRPAAWEVRALLALDQAWREEV